MEDAKPSGKEEKGINKTSQEFEARHNLIGLFSLLYAIDRRINPDNYKHPKKNSSDKINS